jgi:hypothetical protein
MESVFHIQGGGYELILNGLLLVLIMIFLPAGVTASGVEWVRRLRRRAARAAGVGPE